MIAITFLAFIIIQEASGIFVPTRKVVTEGRVTEPTVTKIKITEQLGTEASINVPEKYQSFIKYILAVLINSEKNGVFEDHQSKISHNQNPTSGLILSKLKHME